MRISRSCGTRFRVRGAGRPESSSRRSSRRSFCRCTAITGSILGQVQKDDRNSIHRHNDTEHRGQWARYVLFLGYGNGRVSCNRAQGRMMAKTPVCVGKFAFYARPDPPVSFTPLELSKSVIEQRRSHGIWKTGRMAASPYTAERNSMAKA